MNFNVTFRSTFPVDFDKHPVGEELAEYLATKYREQGLDIILADNYNDFAWMLTLKTRSNSPWLIVGHVGDDAFEWLIQINSGVSWIGRLLGRSDLKLQQEITLKLHTILARDTAFSDVRWHQGDFSAEGWTSTPSE